MGARQLGGEEAGSGEVSVSGVDDLDQEGPHLNGRSQVVLHERIATIEEQLRAVKEDGRVVRSTMHEVNNNMQMFVVLERECGKALTTLSQSFADMKVTLAEITAEQLRRKGAWGAYVMLGSMLMGAVAIGGGIATIGIWLHGH
jgi:hypothetical protein